MPQMMSMKRECEEKRDLSRIRFGSCPGPQSSSLLSTAAPWRTTPPPPSTGYGTTPPSQPADIVPWPAWVTFCPERFCPDYVLALNRLAKSKWRTGRVKDCTNASDFLPMSKISIVIAVGQLNFSSEWEIAGEGCACKSCWCAAAVWVIRAVQGGTRQVRQIILSGGVGSLPTLSKSFDIPVSCLWSPVTPELSLLTKLKAVGFHPPPQQEWLSENSCPDGKFLSINLLSLVLQFSSFAT